MMREFKSILTEQETHFFGQRYFFLCFFCKDLLLHLISDDCVYLTVPSVSYQGSAPSVIRILLHLGPSNESVVMLVLRFLCLNE